MENIPVHPYQSALDTRNPFQNSIGGSAPNFSAAPPPSWGELGGAWRATSPGSAPNNNFPPGREQNPFSTMNKFQSSQEAAQAWSLQGASEERIPSGGGISPSYDAYPIQTAPRATSPPQEQNSTQPSGTGMKTSSSLLMDVLDEPVLQQESTVPSNGSGQQQKAPTGNANLLDLD